MPNKTEEGIKVYGKIVFLLPGGAKLEIWNKKDKPLPVSDEDFKRINAWVNAGGSADA